MPNIGNVIGGMAIVFAAIVALCAAAIVRRLHDRGKTGAWGLIPLPFIAFASVMMPKSFAQNPPDMGLFFAIFLNNVLYLVSWAYLTVQLARVGTTGENRFGADPAAIPAEAHPPLKGKPLSSPAAGGGMLSAAVRGCRLGWAVAGKSTR